LADQAGVSVRAWGLSDPQPFAVRARAAISAVNDPDDRVPRAASRGGVPYAVITW